jgi:RNA polymerase sigma-70 factor (ECF subfamily)
VPVKRPRVPEDELLIVYRQNVSAVYAFFAYSATRDLAEELTQMTFERVLRAWSTYDPKRGTVRVWLLAIARHVLTDHYRRERHRVGPSLDEHPLLLESLVSTMGVDDHVAAVETLKTWLAHLSPKEQKVLALRYGADLSAAETARLLDISEANVHQIASRSLRRLRTVLAEDPEIRDTVARLATR